MDLEAVNGKLSRLAPLRDASIGPAPPPSLETWSCLGWWEGWRPVSFDGLGCPSKAQVPMLEGVEMPPVFWGEGAALFLAGNHASDFPRLDTCPTLPPTRRRRKEPIPPCCLTLTLTPLSLWQASLKRNAYLSPSLDNSLWPDRDRHRFPRLASPLYKSKLGRLRLPRIFAILQRRASWHL